MCSGPEVGSYLRIEDFVYHSTLGLGVIQKKGTPTILLNWKIPETQVKPHLVVSILFLECVVSLESLSHTFTNPMLKNL